MQQGAMACVLLTPVANHGQPGPTHVPSAYRLSGSQRFVRNHTRISTCCKAGVERPSVRPRVARTQATSGASTHAFDRFKTRLHCLSGQPKASAGSRHLASPASEQHKGAAGQPTRLTRRISGLRCCGPGPGPIAHVTSLCLAASRPLAPTVPCVHHSAGSVRR